MATITANVETPDRTRVVGATIVIGNPITNAVGNGVLLELDNSGIADKTTDSNGQATWTVPDDYFGVWLVHILDSDGSRLFLASNPYRIPQLEGRGEDYHHIYCRPVGVDRTEGHMEVSAGHPFLLEVV
jgi:hypothetical protein